MDSVSTSFCELKIIDFGLSKTLAPGEKAYSFVGVSPKFVSVNIMLISI